jgi:hypothetical protein
LHPNPRITSLHVTGAALASLVAACAQRPAVPTIEVAPVSDSLNLTFEYRPGTWSYLATAHRIVERDVGGRIRVDSVLLEYGLTTEIVGEPPAMTVHFVIDTVFQATAQNILPWQIGRASGARFTARLSPSGRLEGLEDPEAGSPLAEALVRGIATFFPIVPPDGAAAQRTWVDTTETQHRQEGAVLIRRSVTSYRSGDWIGGDGGEPVLEVEWEQQYRVEGSGEQFGQSFTVRGLGTASGRTRLSADGRYLGTVRQDDLHAELTNDVQGIVTPVRQHQIDTTRVLR